MARIAEVGKTATRIYQSDGFTCIRYHHTDVVKFNSKKIILNSDGWKTATTKTRMNQASVQFGLGFHVWQEKGQWFVSADGYATMPYHDGMILFR